MKIGELAKRTGLGIETVRYYERERILPEPPRVGAGYRDYPEEAVERLRFVGRAKEIGFSLREIRELFELKSTHKSDCHEVKARVEEKIVLVEKKIRELQDIRESLRQVGSACDGSDAMDDCPIMNFMDTGVVNEKKSCH